jgi:hypothetical protein
MVGSVALNYKSDHLWEEAFMARIGSWVWDVHSSAPVYWSPEMCRLYGRDRLTGPPSSKEYRTLHRPEDWSNWMAAVQECVIGGAEIELDSHLILADLPVKRVRISGRPIAAGGQEVTEILGLTTELSDSAKEDCDLRPEHRFRQMIDFIPAPRRSVRSRTGKCLSGRLPAAGVVSVQR